MDIEAQTTWKELMAEWDELEKVRQLLENEKANSVATDLELVVQLEAITGQQKLLKNRIDQLVLTQRDKRNFDGESLMVAVLDKKNGTGRKQ